MLDKEFRKTVAAMLKEEGIPEEDQPLLFTNHSYDNSIIGLTALDGRVVYLYDSMIQEFMEDEDCSEEDAIEWIECNTLRALGFGDKGHNPIVVTLSRNYLKGGD